MSDGLPPGRDVGVWPNRNQGTVGIQLGSGKQRRFISPEKARELADAWEREVGVEIDEQGYEMQELIDDTRSAADAAEEAAAKEPQEQPGMDDQISEAVEELTADETVAFHVVTASESGCAHVWYDPPSARRADGMTQSQLMLAHLIESFAASIDREIPFILTTLAETIESELEGVEFEYQEDLE